MNGRDRVLAALRGEPTDRAAVNFELGTLRQQLRQQGIEDPDVHFGVDLKKIWFVPSAQQAARNAARRADSPRVGNDEQLANYILWGYYPDEIDRRNPLIGAGCVEDIEAYPFPLVESQDDVSRLRSAVDSHHQRGFAVAGQVPQLGGVVFETAYRLRGLDNLLEDFRWRPDFAEALLERITETACRNVLQLIACGVDIVVLGDDIGTPTSMLISPGMWRGWIKPRLARIIEAARRADPGIAVAYHSDGFYRPVIADLIEIGVSILNPVQPDCMDPLEVRRQFGESLTLWGTVGAARLLPFATPEEIRREVRLRIETLGRCGRLIVSPAYDLEDDVPLANAVGFLEACR